MAPSRAAVPPAAALVVAAFLAAGCSPRAYVAARAADAVSAGGDVFARDDDPQLVREAAPFALKAMESLREANPRHEGLHLSLCRGFTQFAAAFVWQEAVESGDPEAAEAGKERAWRLFIRARDYGLAGLDLALPGFSSRLAADGRAAAAGAGRDEVPLLYWTAAAWGLAASAKPGDPAMLADLPRIEALMRRALELREDYGAGAIHEFFVAFDGGRPEAMGGSIAAARRHYERAVALSGGMTVSPHVTLAATVAVRVQDREEFVALLDRALAFDAREGPREHLLANLAAQRKARWLKGRADDLFAD